MQQKATSALFNRALILATWAMLLTSLSGVTAAAATPWVTVNVSTANELEGALLTARDTHIPTKIVVAPGHYRLQTLWQTGIGGTELGSLPAITGKVLIVGADAGTTILDGSQQFVRIFTVNPGGYLVVRNLTVSGGSALRTPVSGGGAVANFGGFVRFDDCLLVGNIGLDLGGAILIVNGRFHLERTRVMNNHTDGMGGGVAIVSGTGYVKDSIISGNRAGPGGGGGIFVRLATITIGDSTVSGNQSYNPSNRVFAIGGGILNYGRVWLSNSAVIENDAGVLNGIGGGIANFGVMRIKNGTVAENSASAFGGGIYNEVGQFDNEDGRLFLRGTTIVGNDVYDEVVGGSCDPQLGPCSGGGGIWNHEGATIGSARSLLANNTVKSATSDCGGQIKSQGHNAIGDVSGCVLLKPTNDQVGVDPRVGELQDNGEPGNAHFPLLPDSPLIDSGGPVSTHFCTFTDQIGQLRTDANGDGKRECDIGAIEFQVP
jgi:hypothetical protein